MTEKEYPIVAVLWEDHSSFHARELPATDDISEFIRPSLSLGLLYKKTRNYIVLVSHIDRYNEYDEADFHIIFKSSILAIQTYGQIKIDKIRKEGD